MKPAKSIFIFNLRILKYNISAKYNLDVQENRAQPLKFSKKITYFFVRI